MNSKLFKQLLINNIFEEKKSQKLLFLSKEKNLSSARKKITSCSQDFKKCKRNSTEKYYLLDNKNCFNLKASTNSKKKKKIIINTKKINKDFYIHFFCWDIIF